MENFFIIVFIHFIKICLWSETKNSINFLHTFTRIVGKYEFCGRENYLIFYKIDSHSWEKLNALQIFTIHFFTDFCLY